MIKRVHQLLQMIKFEHTVFALPFALISVVLASRELPTGRPSWQSIVSVLAAMVGARSAAMAFNRLVDCDIDLANPRTACRHIPAGILTRNQVGVFLLASIVVFEAAAYSLNRLCFALSPIALALVLGYSYTKRFTWFCHFVLGLAIGIAPIGAWIAIKGTLSITPVLLGAVVLFWIGGFDIIYALQDYEHDLASPIYSLPKRLGKSRAITVSRILHVAVLSLLILIGSIGHLHTLYFTGVVIVGILLLWEQSMVKPDDLRRINIAFFTMNGWVGVSLFGFVLLDRCLGR